MSDEIDYKADLEYTRDIRKKLINKLTDGGNIPTDDKTARVLLTALKDMDKATIDTKRNDIDEKRDSTAEDIIYAVLETVKSQRNKDPFMGEEARGKIPTLDKEALGHQEHVPGEDEIGLIHETADAFIERMSAKEKDQPDKKA